jgi:tetratricopeptide (TPR) repeat protein
VASDAVADARLAVKQVKQAAAMGRYRAALRRSSRALDVLRDDRSRKAAGERARLFIWRGWVRSSQDRPNEAIAWYRRGVAEARRARDDEALAQAYLGLDTAYFETGELDKARYSPRALALYERRGDLGRQALMLNNMGVLAKERSEWDEARTLYDRARHLFELTGDRSYETLVKFNVAEILSDQGDYAEAERLLREVVRAWRAAGADTDLAEARRELARALARQGDHERALALLDGARSTQLEHRQVAEVLTTDLRRAEVLLLARRGEEALAIAASIEAGAASTESGPLLATGLHRVRGWAMLQGGDPVAAAEHFRAALALATERGDAFQATLALDGLLASLAPDDPGRPDVAARRDTMVRRLGISRTPSIPTGS